MSDSDVYRSGDDDNDNESIMCDEPCYSLFRPETLLKSPLEQNDFDRDNFHFDLVQFVRSNELDMYGRIRVINYIRAMIKLGRTPAETIASLTISPSPFDNDQYLIPALENDALLFSFDDGHEDDDDAVTQLKAENHDLKLQITSMRNAFRTALDLNDNEVVDNDDGYFRGYSHVDIHEEMLRDTQRTDAYMQFCNGNPHLFKGKVVLDIGCGSGILSMFAARCGAARVIAIDNAEIIHKARRAVQRNGFENVIELIQGKVEDIVLDCKVDLIISEWMGYFLLFESMLSTVLWARDQWSIDPRHVYPDRAVINIQAVQTRTHSQRHMSFWEDLYGFDMSDIAEPNTDLEACRSTGRAAIEMLPPDATITNSAQLIELHMSTVTNAQLDFTAPFILHVLRDETLDALSIDFSVFFEEDCITPIRLGTGTSDPYTHWRQTVLMLQSAINVTSGDVIKGVMRASRPETSPRDYQITIDMSINESLLPTLVYTIS